MAKIVTWDAKETKKNLYQRLNNAMDFRKNRVDYEWEESERTVFSTNGDRTDVGTDYNYWASDVDGGMDGDSAEGMGVNYVFKNLRFIHAQLSANPPSVVARPTSSDSDDRRRADAADRIIRHSLRKYDLQETFDRCSLNCLLYGTGFIKTVWDSDKGEIFGFDPESGEIEMEGDISITIPNNWNIWFDPDAETWSDVRYLFEKIVIPYEEAIFRWPEQKELLNSIRVKNSKSRRDSNGGESALSENKYDVVEVYEYWEKGLPLNGMAGRYAVCTKEGVVLDDLRPNPHRFAPAREPDEKEKIAPRPPIATLPYQIFTDLDVPNQVWGKSVVLYEAPLQDILNRVDSVSLDNMQAHAVARIVIPEGTEIADDSITNSPHDIIKFKGTQPPHYMSPMPWPAEANAFRDRIKVGIDDMAGINESMFGQQSREQSGFSMQYATNQGNMIRRRLFNKYVRVVESTYKTVLNLVRKHWTTSKTVLVLGKEKAFEAKDIKGADVDGGFDLVVEYGASLSLDPTTRREEIMTLMPVFEKAGVDTKTILSMLKLNELESLYDMLDRARDRQREIFESMIANDTYIEPEEIQEHQGMLDYAYYYVMGTEFKYLEDEHKALVIKHIKAREELITKQVEGVGPQPMPGAPGPAPGGPDGALPQGPEMTGETAPAPEMPV